MAAARAKKELALDSNVLFDLADGREFAHALLEILREQGFKLVVPPTVVQEIVLIAGDIREATNKRDLATKALENMLDWGIVPYDLRSVGHGITEQFAKCLIHKGLLPVEEFNDGQILAETALANVPGLVTSDKHLLEIDNQTLQELLKEKDLSPVYVCHPKNLLRRMK
jgi:predicted nucleic acid-binding protein